MHAQEHNDLTLRSTPALQGQVRPFQRTNFTSRTSDSEKKLEKYSNEKKPHTLKTD